MDVCVSVPYDVENIPPSSPVHHVRYVYIYDYTPDIVYVGYTPGYTGCYIYGPTVVYGTGYYYHSWYGTYYYPRPRTFGYHMYYDPYNGWSIGFSMPIWRPYSWYSWYYYDNPRYHYHYYGGYWGPPAYHPPYHHHYHHYYGQSRLHLLHIMMIQKHSQQNVIINTEEVLNPVAVFPDLLLHPARQLVQQELNQAVKVQELQQEHRPLHVSPQLHSPMQLSQLRSLPGDQLQQKHRPEPQQLQELPRRGHQHLPGRLPPNR